MEGHLTIPAAVLGLGSIAGPRLDGKFTFDVVSVRDDFAYATNGKSAIRVPWPKGSPPPPPVEDVFVDIPQSAVAAFRCDARLLADLLLAGVRAVDGLAIVNDYGPTRPVLVSVASTGQIYLRFEKRGKPTGVEGILCPLVRKEPDYGDEDDEIED